MTLEAVQSGPISEQAVGSVLELEILPVPEQRKKNPETLSRTALTEIIQSFGAQRLAEGDEFARPMQGCYAYRTHTGLVGISVWGPEQQPTLSVYACARTDLTATLELYRAVSAWRATSGLGNPYLAERPDGTAAVLCEQTFGGRQLYREASVELLLTSTIDCVGEIAAAMSIDLAGHGGVRLEETGAPTGAAYYELFGWWQVKDPRISQLMGYV